ncbi:hypothetical protein [Azospirillum griseum]|uniref:Uncharacterized protein n=1 Tax=Azospirillum griseum TaxID=2496639 RepID=A0A431VLP7_9PROT|nr:hypothetical protein [Azospirillum griseum]RTR22366.1 hypothetical protein EJ903_05910 [Azospirillum griseum]
MTTLSVSNRSTIRGADGRLYSITANGVSEVVENQTASARSVMRAGERASFDTADLESGRMVITSGL